MFINIQFYPNTVRARTITAILASALACNSVNSQDYEVYSHSPFQYPCMAASEGPRVNGVDTGYFAALENIIVQINDRQEQIAEFAFPGVIPLGLAYDEREQRLYAIDVLGNLLSYFEEDGTWSDPTMLTEFIGGNAGDMACSGSYLIIVNVAPPSLYFYHKDTLNLEGIVSLSPLGTDFFALGDLASGELITEELQTEKFYIFSATPEGIHEYREITFDAQDPAWMPNNIYGFGALPNGNLVMANDIVNASFARKLPGEEETGRAEYYHSFPMEFSPYGIVFDTSEGRTTSKNFIMTNRDDNSLYMMDALGGNPVLWSEAVLSGGGRGITIGGQDHPSIQVDYLWIAVHGGHINKVDLSGNLATNFHTDITAIGDVSWNAASQKLLACDIIGRRIAVIDPESFTTLQFVAIPQPMGVSLNTFGMTENSSLDTLVLAGYVQGVPRLIEYAPSYDGENNLADMHFLRYLTFSYDPSIPAQIDCLRGIAMNPLTRQYIIANGGECTYSPGLFYSVDDGVVQPTDINRDFQVDIADANDLCASMSGPEEHVPPGDPELFTHSDLDGDLDADLADFASFQTAYRPSY